MQVRTPERQCGSRISSKGTKGEKLLRQLVSGSFRTSIQFGRPIRSLSGSSRGNAELPDEKGNRIEECDRRKADSRLLQRGPMAMK
jgi:hypothetical protein